jgi:hypothetical protein
MRSRFVFGGVVSVLIAISNDRRAGNVHADRDGERNADADSEPGPQPATYAAADPAGRIDPSPHGQPDAGRPLVRRNAHSACSRDSDAHL